MRRRPTFVRAFFALFVFWSAAHLLPAGTTAREVVAVGAVPGEAVMLSPALPATGAHVAPLKKASAPDCASWLFLPARSVIARDPSRRAAPTPAKHGIRGRENLTFTYDATAPPAASPHPVD